MVEIFRSFGEIASIVSVQEILYISSYTSNSETGRSSETSAKFTRIHGVMFSDTAIFGAKWLKAQATQSL
jgi:hypothetical protein